MSVLDRAKNYDHLAFISTIFNFYRRTGGQSNKIIDINDYENDHIENKTIIFQEKW